MSALGIRDNSPPPPDEQPIPCCAIGLDLGKLSDPTALALLKWEFPRKRAPHWRAKYSVPVLRRWPLGTPYLDIVEQVAYFIGTLPDLFGTLPDRIWPLLVVDSTGVGAAVVEEVVRHFKQVKAIGGYVAITITAGNAVTLRENAHWNVSKRQLASHLEVVMGSRRLHVAEEMPDCNTLKRELRTFTIKITESLNETFEAWRQRDHDDLVLATALAIFAAERGLAYRKIADAFRKRDVQASRYPGDTLRMLPTIRR